MRHSLLAAAVALLSGCVSVPPLTVKGPLSTGSSTSQAWGWGRLAERQSLVGGPKLQFDAYLSCANAALEDRDFGTESMCLASAFRLSFGLGGMGRWEQEKLRVMVARRLEAAYVKQGLHGLAAAYGVMAALGEAYEDSGQADRDRASYERAQKAVAAAQRAKSEAQAQAAANFMTQAFSNAYDAASGAMPSDYATMKTLQAVMDYAKEESAIQDASRGLGASAARLERSAVRPYVDQAPRLLAIYMEDESVADIYAKAAQKAVRAHAARRPSGAVDSFLALAPPDRSKSARADFVRSFKEASRKMQDADFDGQAPPLNPLSPWQEPAQPKPKDPLKASWSQFYLGGYSVGAHTRQPEFERKYQVYQPCCGWKNMTDKKNEKVALGSGTGAMLDIMLFGYPTPSAYGSMQLGFNTAEAAAARTYTAQGSMSRLIYRVGAGLMLGPKQGGPVLGSLGASTSVLSWSSYSVGDGIVTSGNSATDMEFLGLDLEAAVHLYQTLKIGVAMPVLAPLGVSGDAGGFRVFAGLNFKHVPTGKRAAAAPAADQVSAGDAAGESAASNREERRKDDRSAEAETKRQAEERKAKAAEQRRLVQRETEEAERQRKAKAAEEKRLAREKAENEEAERKAKAAEAKRLARAKAEKEEAERKAKEAEAKRQAEAQAQQAEQERKAKAAEDRRLAQQKAQQQEEERLAALAALKEKQRAQAAERRKLDAEREAIRLQRKALAEQAVMNAEPKNGGVALELGYWRQDPLDAMQNASNSRGSAPGSGIRSTPFGEPFSLGIGLRRGAWAWENTVTLASSDAKLVVPVAKGSSSFVAKDAQYASWVSALGADINFWSGRRLQFYAPLRLDLGLGAVTVGGAGYSAPTVGGSIGLGSRWRMSPSLGVNATARFHGGLEIASYSGDAGPLQVGDNEIEGSTGGPDFRLGLEWLLW